MRRFNPPLFSNALTLLVTLAAFGSSSSARATTDPWSDDGPGAYPWSTAQGDFDGDGLMDTVFGYPQYDDGRGMIAICFGTGDPRDCAVDHRGFSEEDFEDELDDRFVRIEADDPVFLFSGVAQAPGSYFGNSVSAGDFDADGKDDLAFGIPGMDIDGNTRAGGVVVIHGADLGDANTAPQVGSATLFSQASPGVASEAENYDYFGDVTATGDVNCDGKADLVIGVPRENIGGLVDAGMVHVLYGSSTGVSGADSSVMYQGDGTMGDAAEPYDNFGATLATGHFTPANYAGIRQCDSLAIGVPREDVDRSAGTVSNAGMVHMLRAVSYSETGGIFGGFKPITDGSEVRLDQDSGGVHSYPEAQDRFGNSLGRVRDGDLDALWVGVPGESWSGCGGGNVHILAYDGDNEFTCSSVRPDVVEAERGLVVQKFDEFGGWLQYIPEHVNPATAEVLVVVHGTNRYETPVNADFPAGLANTHRFMSYDGFVPTADWYNLIIIMPQFEDSNFGNRGIGDVQGGYRALLGANIDADEWVETIVDRYAETGLGDGRFHLFGHSAGAQFATRYFTQHPERLLEVLLETPANMVDGSSGTTWPSGLSPLSVANSSWGPLSYTPDSGAMKDAVTGVGATHLVGELEQLDPDTNNYANLAWWPTTFPAAWGQHDIKGCIIAGVDHNSRDMHRTALQRAWPFMAWHPDFADAPGCL